MIGVPELDAKALLLNGLEAGLDKNMLPKLMDIGAVTYQQGLIDYSIGASLGKGKNIVPSMTVMNISQAAKHLGISSYMLSKVSSTLLGIYLKGYYYDGCCGNTVSYSSIDVAALAEKAGIFRPDMEVPLQ